MMYLSVSENKKRNKNKSEKQNSHNVASEGRHTGRRATTPHRPLPDLHPTERSDHTLLGDHTNQISCLIILMTISVVGQKQITHTNAWGLGWKPQ